MVDNRLPSRFFGAGQKPKKSKINPYFQFWMIDEVIAKALRPKQLAKLKRSPFGMLLNLPSMCAFGARFTHYLLCKQLVTKKKYELWFLFGGKPWRFSLREFGIVTGLCCGKLPNKDNKGKSVFTKKKKGKSVVEDEDSYWSTLFGDEENVTVDWIVDTLKRGQVTDPELRMRYACLLLAEGILCPTSRITPISRESVELVKDVDKFLAYPWGTMSFKQTLQSIKSITTKELANPSIAIQGFVYALQLVALKAIPAINCKLNPARGKILLSVVWKIEKNTEVQVVPFIEGDLPIEEKDMCLSDEEDEKVDYLMELVAKNNSFSDDMWNVQSRVVVPPILRTPAKKMKRKTAKKSSVRKVLEKPEKVQITGGEAQGTASCTILRTPAKKMKKKTAKKSSVRKVLENPEKVQVTGGEAQGTASYTILRTPAKKTGKKTAKGSSVRRAENPEKVQVTYGEAQGTEPCQRGTTESNTQYAFDHKTIATMVDEAVQSKISELPILKTRVEELMSAVRRLEELMSAVLSVGVCRHGISMEAENNGDFRYDSQKEQFPNNKKKRTLEDDDSTEISNQAKEVDKVPGAIPTSSTYDEKGCSQELAFLDSVHAKLNASGYKEFVGSLVLFSNKLISQQKLQDLVSSLMGAHPDLMEAFRDFVVRCEKNEGFLSYILTKKFLPAGQSNRSEPNLSSTARTPPSTIDQYAWSLGAPTAKRQKLEGSWLPTKQSAQSGLSQAPRTNILGGIF